jgi:hypothetical protein
MLVISDVNKQCHCGARLVGQNDVTWGQPDRTVMPPDQKVNEVQELTYSI